MLRLEPQPDLVHLLELEANYTAEQWLEIELLARPLSAFREHPDLAVMATSGVVLPVHQRRLLYTMHRGAPSNVVVASRGTSKSSVSCVLYPSYRLLCYPKTTAVTLSATGFRGGQLIFNDTDRWMRGGWDSQRRVPAFYLAAMRGGGINRSQNYWSYRFDNHSQNLTLPTKDPDSIRGVRANLLFVDEANTTDLELLDKVVLPFLNVRGDFEHGGRYALQNQVYYTTTIDYSWRPFSKRIAEAKAGIARDRQAVEASRLGDWKRYDELKQDGLFQHTYTQFDYTDVLIRSELVNRRGKRFRVHWPEANHPAYEDPQGIPFLERGEDGTMLRRGSPVVYHQTYPVDKDTLELSLLSGTVDEASWLSEQRNIVDETAGDVYAQRLVDQAAQVGEFVAVDYRALPERWRKAHQEEQLDYRTPVLWRSSDPCVLGVDYAPRGDMCAFVVIRIGPLAKGVFDPETHEGETPWSNVVWAEQHRRMSHHDVAQKIRHLLERYNVVWFNDPYVTDPAQICRGIGLDMYGGGEGVRDALCFINDDQPPLGQFRIYDPLDNDERLRAFAADTAARPMLDAIRPSDGLNDRLVEFTVGQMQQGLLYLPHYLPKSARPQGARELNVGYEAARMLDHQLRKLRQRPTKNFRSFYMDGDTHKDVNKKDLWAAFIYAAKQLRAHLIRKARLDNAPPPMAARILQINGRRGDHHGRAAGARR